MAGSAAATTIAGQDVPQACGVPAGRSRISEGCRLALLGCVYEFQRRICRSAGQAAANNQAVEDFVFFVSFNMAMYFFGTISLFCIKCLYIMPMKAFMLFTMRFT